MSGAGKPLRFLGLMLGGWVAMRVAIVVPPMLWTKAVSVAQPPVAQRDEPARVAAPAKALTFLVTEAVGPSLIAPQTQRAGPHAQQVQGWSDATADLLLDLSSAFRMPPRSLGSPEEAVRALGPASMSPFVAPRVAPIATSGPVLQAPPSRWSASAWMLWRPDSAGLFAVGPLLGGSQAGVRLDYRLWQAGERSLGVYGRATRAINRPFAEEAALGVALRPVAGLPMSILVERRERLGQGGRSGFALLASGGIGPQAIAPRIALEGYAQGGIVGLPGADAFADGRLTLGYRLTPRARQPDIALGLGLSGSAQTGASRLDIGPELRFKLPIAGGHARLSAEWRQRVAGDARPSSGPVLALVADF